MRVLCAFYTKSSVNLQTAELDLDYNTRWFAFGYSGTDLKDEQEFRDYVPAALSLSHVYSAYIRA